MQVPKKDSILCVCVCMCVCIPYCVNGLRWWKKLINLKNWDWKKKWNWADGEIWGAHSSAVKVWSHLVYEAKLTGT